MAERTRKRMITIIAQTRVTLSKKEISTWDDDELRAEIEKIDTEIIEDESNQEPS